MIFQLAHWFGLRSEPVFLFSFHYRTRIGFTFCVVLNAVQSTDSHFRSVSPHLDVFFCWLPVPPFISTVGSSTQQTHRLRLLSPITSCDWKWISKQSSTYHLYIVANRSIGGGVSNNTGTAPSSRTSSRGGRKDHIGKGGHEAESQNEDERGKQKDKRSLSLKSWQIIIRKTWWSLRLSLINTTHQGNITKNNFSLVFRSFDPIMYAFRLEQPRDRNTTTCSTSCATPKLRLTVASAHFWNVHWQNSSLCYHQVHKCIIC